MVSLGIYSMTRYPFGQKIEVPHWTLLPSSKLSDAKLETEQCRIDKWHKCKGRDYRIGVLYDLKRLNQVELSGRHMMARVTDDQTVRRTVLVEYLRLLSSAP